MECDLVANGCQMDRIADSLESTDWLGFFLTVLATVVGAAIAALFAWILWRRDRRDNYRRSVDGATAEVMLALSTTGIEITRFHKELIESISLVGSSEGVRQPDRVRLDVGLEVLIIVTQGSDRDVAVCAREVAYDATTTVMDPEWQVAALAAVRRVLWRWRARQTNAEVTLIELKKVNLQNVQRLAEPNSEPVWPAPFERRYTRNPAPAESE
jgi:hypothetical protein